MTISIITATYNSAATVRDTLTSVSEQKYHSIEHIIVDGQSTDNTLHIVNEFPHVKKIVSGKDKGIYDAMNKGIQLATGDVIGILNSDDIYAHDKVIAKVAAAFSNEAVDAVYSDLLYVSADDINKVIRYWKSGNYNSKKFYWGWMPPHPTFFVRQHLYKQYGTFNLSLRSAADYELMLRLLLKHQVKAGYIPEVMVKMRTGGMSNSNIKNRIKANREDRKAWKLNELDPYFFTLMLKPVRKIFQYINKN
jgi:glycosyltransferase involved in cell wall biosynthesis